MELVPSCSRLASRLPVFLCISPLHSNLQPPLTRPPTTDIIKAIPATALQQTSQFLSPTSSTGTASPAAGPSSPTGNSTSSTTSSSNTPSAAPNGPNSAKATSSSPAPPSPSASASTSPSSATSANTPTSPCPSLSAPARTTVPCTWSRGVCRGSRCKSCRPTTTARWWRRSCADTLRRSRRSAPTRPACRGRSSWSRRSASVTFIGSSTAPGGRVAA